MFKLFSRRSHTRRLEVSFATVKGMQSAGDYPGPIVHQLFRFLQTTNNEHCKFGNLRSTPINTDATVTPELAKYLIKDKTHEKVKYHSSKPVIIPTYLHGVSLELHKNIVYFFVIFILLLFSFTGFSCK